MVQGYSSQISACPSGGSSFFVGCGQGGRSFVTEDVSGFSSHHGGYSYDQRSAYSTT